VTCLIHLCVQIDSDFFSFSSCVSQNAALTIAVVRGSLYCNTLQHTAIHCNTLQYAPTFCNTLQYTYIDPDFFPVSSGVLQDAAVTIPVVRGPVKISQKSISLLNLLSVYC